MKKILTTFAMLMLVGIAFAQDRVLNWDQLMDRSLYPQREMRYITFRTGTDSHKFVYMKDTSVYLSDVKGDHLLIGQDREDALNLMRGRCEGMSPDGIHMAKVEDGILKINDGERDFVVEAADGYQVVLGESVHRNEFGINGGLFWSPNGNRLAFYRMDQSMVKDYPLVNTKIREAETMPIKYPMAGMKSHEVTIGIYEVSTNRLLYLDTRRDTTVHEREMYLTNITWSPDEQYIYIAKVNREQNHMWFERYNATTGKLDKVLFEEENQRYVEPCDPMIFFPNGDQFLWLSMRDGYKHLYIYKTDGTLVKQLTTGEYEVEGVLGFDRSGKNLFIYANKDNLTGRAAYKVNINSGEITAITATEGTHTVVINSLGTMLIDQWSSVNVPAKAELRDIMKNKVVRTLYTAENPLKDYAMPDVKLGTIKAADGKTDLYYRLLTPPNMKPGEKYPTLVYVYGGPHSQLVTDSWLAGAGNYMAFLAQHGYVVFTVDNRGTDNRGFEFESCTHRHLGEIETADQMKGVQFLQSLPYVDTSRMGVEGWSFGGFMTITMKIANPEIFKVGCAGGPVIDWKWYEIMYGERYMDTPQENPVGYENASLLNKAKNLKGHLLVIHGAEDNTVMWQNSLEFIERCINSLIPVDYFVYPHHEHNVMGQERNHLYKKMFDYYEDHLK